MERAFKIVPWIIALGLLAGLVFTTTRMLQAKYDLSVSEANIRALQAEVERWQTETENAASRFQLQQKIDQDSVKKLESALGLAVREQQLTTKALQSAELAFSTVQRSNDAMLSLLEVKNPEGREERIEVFLLEEDGLTEGQLPVVGEIIVAVPADDEQPAELETSFTLLPFKIETALGCTPQKDATVVLQTPPWVTATPALGQVDPEVCHGERPSTLLGLNVTAGSLVVGGAIGAALMALLVAVF